MAFRRNHIDVNVTGPNSTRRRLLTAATGLLGLTATDTLRAALPVCPVAPLPTEFPYCGETALERRAEIDAGIREFSNLRRVVLPRLRTLGQPFTVSGISSGAAMAMQMHFAHSKHIRGAGLFAGPPYGCAITGDGGNDIYDRLCRALSICMQSSPGTPKATDISALIDSLAKAGKIDPTSELTQGRVWILEGKADSVLNPNSARVTAEVYRHYLGDSSAVRYEERDALEHAWPTGDPAIGSSCALKGPPYINACGYAGTDLMLEFLRQRPPGNGNGARLAKFSQRRFLWGFGGNLAEDGLIALPPTIDSNTRLHVAFHGCEQSTQCLGTTFAREAGLVTASAKFNLVILMPQVNAMPYSNPKGCWDWWGYNERLSGSLVDLSGRSDDFVFMTQCGDQINPVMTMALAVTGGTLSRRC